MNKIRAAVSAFGRPTGGNSAVEFGLIIPVLAFLVLALVDYAMYVSDNMRVAKGVASAVQFAMYNVENEQGIRDVAYSASNFSTDTATVDVLQFCECHDQSSVSCDAGCDDGEHKRIFVEVGMEYTYKPMFDYPFVPKSVILTRSATIQVP